MQFKYGVLIEAAYCLLAYFVTVEPAHVASNGTLNLAVLGMFYHACDVEQLLIFLQSLIELLRCVLALTVESESL